MTQFVKQLERWVRLFQAKADLFQEANEEVICNYGEYIFVLRRNIQKVFQIISPRFILFAMSISGPYQNGGSKKRLELKYFGKDQCRPWTERSVRISSDGARVKNEEFVMSQDPFFMRFIGIYKHSLRSESSIFLDRSEAMFEISA